MSVITTAGLTKRYGTRRGIEDVSLHVSEGSLFGFLGPNGAGKSTTIRILLGFMQASEGRATVLGHDCWRESDVLKREVGYVPGDVRLYSWMTGRIALRISGRMRGRDLTRHGSDLAERFGLDLSVRADRMSRGMRQKLGLLLALAHEPKLAVLDEPTSGLDPLMQDELADILREFAARGHTVFFSSHTLSEVEQLCDRVAIVRDGRIVEDESIANLRARARRTAILHFESAQAAASTAAPPQLVELERTGRLWRAQLETDDARAFARWVAEQPIEDFSVSPPNLEGVFRAYYRSVDEAGVGEDGGSA